MNPIRISSLLFLLASFLLAPSCRKKEVVKEIQFQYPEDPSTTTLTPRERLNASWRIYAYQFKGVDILKEMDTLNGGKAKIEDVGVNYAYWPDQELWLFLLYNKDFNFLAKDAFNIDDPYYIRIYGSANRFLSMCFITPFKYDPNNSKAEAKWKIMKLFDTDLNLVLSTDSGDYKLFLKKY